VTNQPPEVNDGSGADELALDDDELTSLASDLDAFSAEAADPWALLQALSSHRAGPDGQGARTALLAACERAFAYSFTETEGRLGSLEIGQRFSSAEGDWPPAFDAVSNLEKRCWARLAELVTHPLPKAHLGDLALATRSATGRDAAEAVVASYLELGAKPSLDPYYQASCLGRALTLARQFSLAAEARARCALYDLARTAVSARNVPPGVLFRALEPLSVRPRTGPFVAPSKPDVLTLLDALETNATASAIISEGVHAVREALAETDEERTAARRALITGYFALAETTEGLLRLTWLQRAASEAQRLGLIDMRDRAVAAMQAMSVDDLNLETASTEFRLPRHALDERLSRYRRSRSALDALQIWLTTPAPTGSHEANLAEAAEQSRRGILQLISRTTLSPDGMPVRSSAGPESAADEVLERLEGFTAAAHGIALAHELMAIGTEHDKVSGDEIGRHLATTYRCDLEKAVALGEAMGRFWERRFGDSARAAYPLVEAGARGLLLALGEPLFRIETGNAEGRFPALEAYAERLEERGLDPDWLRTIRGPVAKLRNSMAHGHKLVASDVDAALLVRTAGLLVLLTPPDSSEVDRSQVRREMRDPLAHAAARAGLRKRWRRVWTM
jgi:hypothetical protein